MFRDKGFSELEFMDQVYKVYKGLGFVSFSYVKATGFNY